MTAPVPHTALQPGMGNLAQAARDARYLFQVYGLFSKPMPLALVEKVNRDLTDALMEFDGTTEADLEVERAMRRSIRRESRERRERLGRGLGNPEAYDCCTGSWGAEGPFWTDECERELLGSDRGGRL